MKLADLHQRLAQGTVGLAAMQDFARACDAALTSDPAHAAFYRLLGGAVSRFVSAHDDGPLDTGAAGQAKTTLLRLTDQAAKSVGAGADKQLAVLNEIAGAELG